MLSSTKFSYRCVSTTSAFTEGAAWLVGVEAVLIAAILKGAMVFGFATSLDCRAAATDMVRRSNIRVLAVVAIVLEIVLKVLVLCSVVIE